jgi:hypothetical protein
VFAILKIRRGDILNDEKFCLRYIPVYNSNADRASLKAVCSLRLPAFEEQTELIGCCNRKVD